MSRNILWRTVHVDVEHWHRIKWNDEQYNLNPNVVACLHGIIILIQYRVWNDSLQIRQKASLQHVYNL